MEFFLGDDILQGEDIPFFLLWTGSDPEKICIEIDGFDSISELHNAEESYSSDDLIIVSKFFVPGYLGGIIKSINSDEPMKIGKIKVDFIYSSGEKTTFEEERKLYTTAVSVENLPRSIYLSEAVLSEKINIKLRGKATVFFEVEEIEGNECKLDVPPEVKETIERVGIAIERGLIDLKKKFPSHKEVIDLILSLDENRKSFTTYAEEIEEKLEQSSEDKDFLEAFVTIFVTSIFKQTGIRDQLILPLKEYFESYSTEKAYFQNPLLHVKIQNTDCLLAIRLIVRDLLKQECGNPIYIQIPIHSDNICSIPIKDIFTLRRLSNDD